MAQVAPREQTTGDQPVQALVSEVRALRDQLVEREEQDLQQDQSPQAFYERSVARDDVREILKRLAHS